MGLENSIVVAVDGSDTAYEAVRWAAGEAGKRDKALHIAACFVAPDTSVPTFKISRFPRAALRNVVATLQQETDKTARVAHQIATQTTPDIAIAQTVKEGNPIEVLLEMSKTATMLVMGTRGLGRMSGIALGSVSTAVVNHAHCPVVAIRKDTATRGFSDSAPVVVGIDGSASSAHTAAMAFKEADARGARLIAVNTWVDSQIYSSFAALQAAEKYAQEMQQQQEALLAECLADLERHYPNVATSKVTSRDHPVNALIGQAAEAQLLVVGSHGRGGFMGMAIGSTASSLLRKTPCPLMVVRPQE